MPQTSEKEHTHSNPEQPNPKHKPSPPHNPTHSNRHTRTHQTRLQFRSHIIIIHSPPTTTHARFTLTFQITSQITRQACLALHQPLANPTFLPIFETEDIVGFCSTHFVIYAGKSRYAKVWGHGVGGQELGEGFFGWGGGFGVAA